MTTYTRNETEEYAQQLCSVRGSFPIGSSFSVQQPEPSLVVVGPVWPPLVSHCLGSADSLLAAPAYPVPGYCCLDPCLITICRGVFVLFVVVVVLVFVSTSAHRLI